MSSLAEILGVSPDTYLSYDWDGRTSDDHRHQIRTLLGFRKATLSDMNTVTVWLSGEAVSTSFDRNKLKIMAYDRYRSLHLEPPTAAQMDRSVRSAIRTAKGQFHASILQRLSVDTCMRLDALLSPPHATAAHDPKADGESGDGSALIHRLKADSVPMRVETAHQDVIKHHHIQALDLPTDLFAQVPKAVVHAYLQRVVAEMLRACVATLRCCG